MWVTLIGIEMIDQKQLDVIDLLYKSILTPESWSEVLEWINHDVGAFGINMLVGDRIFGELQNVWITESMRPAYSALFEKDYIRYEVPMLERLGQISPMPNLLHSSVIEQAHNQLSTDQLDNSFLQKCLFDNFRIKDRYLTPLHHHASQFDSLCLNFMDTPPQDIEQRLQRCDFYLPHLSNLLNFSRPFLLLQARFNAVLEVLDKLKLGIFLLTEKGEVVDTNRAAEHILDQQDGIAIDLKQRFLINDPDSAQRFSQAVSQVARPDSLDSAERGTTLTVPRKSGGTPLLLEVSAVMHHELPIHAMVMVIDPDQHAVVDTSHFADLFGLTGAEQNICQLLAEGIETCNIAEMRNTGIETLRTQVKSVQMKTGTNDQSELVRLAVSINVPLDD